MAFNPEIFYQAERASHDAELFKLVDKEKYKNALIGLPCYSIELRGICVGGAVMKDDKFHIAVMPAARGYVGAKIIEAVDWGLSIKTPFLAEIKRNNVEVMGVIDRYTHELVDQDAETLTYKIFSRKQK